MPPAPPAATDFATAIARLRWSALKRFNEGFDIANTPPAAPDPAWPEERKREFAKQEADRISKAEGQMAKALAQLADLDQQISDTSGRADVAALMRTTATTAASVCRRISDMAGPAGSAPPPFASTYHLDALSRVLAALAALSPAENWRETPSGDASK